MAKAKATTTDGAETFVEESTVGAQDNITVVEPVVTETIVEPVAVATREDQLIAILGDMIHEDDSIWNDDGTPNLKYLTIMLDKDGPPVTAEEINAIDPTFKRMPKTDEERAKESATGDVAVVVPAPAPKPIVYTHDDLKAVDKEWQEALLVKAQAEKALKAIEAKRDPIVNALAHNPNGQSFAHAVQEMQKRTQETAMQRVAHLEQFKKLTGGVIPSAYPSKLDERAATRRSVQRRAARDA